MAAPHLEIPRPAKRGEGGAKRRVRGGAPALLLLLAAVSARADFREFKSCPVDPSMAVAIRRAADDTLKENPRLTADNLAITLIDVTHASTIQRADLGGDAPFYPASVVKIFYMAETFHQKKEIYFDVRKLIALGVVGVVKPGRVGEPADRRFRTGEKVPATGRAESSVPPDVFLFLGRRLRRHVTRIDAHGDYVEFLSHVELQFGERAGDAFHHQAAEHRTAVVHEVEHDRLAAEFITETDDASRLVAEHHVERQLGVEVLLNVDAAGKGGRCGGGIRHSSARAQYEENDER